MRVYTIVLEGMEFFAYHGCREDEKTNGNTFVVDLRASYSGDAGSTDNLDDAVNYGSIYKTIAAQMQVRSNLLEHVAQRILDSLRAEFAGLDAIEVTVSKKNPPVEGPCRWSRVIMNWKRDE